ncbi:class I SAM-dependent methyltransferase [Sulfurimonas sp.]|uniref:class I SAM-dependent methyltransferase n=1 Tax=Sulfurimonas sp. TaxID=2022749 RepID=UPI00356689E1
MNKRCLVCNHDDFNILFDYTKEKVVTSDNKTANQNFQLLECKKCFHIQKKTDESLLKTIENIYSNYEAYYLTNGKEEEHTDSKKATINRSKTLINNISESIKEHGNILDIGTGSGVFLEEFSKVFDWNLFAQDVKISQNNNLQNLKNFKKFFIYKQDVLFPDYFDIISAIHVFEHIVDLNEFLSSVKRSLKKDGVLVLQVPNIDENLFDIFTIDHISHFHKSTLLYILKKYFKNVYFPKKQINREISVLATDKVLKLEHENDVQRHQINKLQINNLIDSISDIKKKVAVFGTSPPALFCASLLNFQIECFIDENLKKTNKTFYGKKIVHPMNIDSDIQVIFPYSLELLESISKRFPSLNFKYIENRL